MAQWLRELVPEDLCAILKNLRGRLQLSVTSIPENLKLYSGLFEYCSDLYLRKTPDTYNKIKQYKGKIETSLF